MAEGVDLSEAARVEARAEIEEAGLGPVEADASDIWLFERWMRS
jgi:hypothetical protein